MTQKRYIKTARDTVRNSSGLLQLCFLTTIVECVKQKIEVDILSLKEMKQELALIEPGVLYIKKNDTNFSFYDRDPKTKHESCINKDSGRIHLLARKEFLELRIASAESQIKCLKSIFSKSKDAVQEQKLMARLQRCANADLDLCRILFTKEQNEWIDEPFSPNPFYPEDLKYPTKGNILMRSLSEAALGNALEELGLPYRPDDLVYLGKNPSLDPALKLTGQSGGSNLHPNRETYFADFKIPNLNGGITIHEHLGAFQLENYSINALQRLNDYHNFTIYEIPGRPVQHEEITWSFGEDVTDPTLLQKLVHRMILPLAA